MAGPPACFERADNECPELAAVEYGRPLSLYFPGASEDG